MSELFIPNLQNFIGLARNRGFARKNRFLVQFFPRGVSSSPNPTISLLCEEANFPGKSIETRSLRINALSEQRAHFVDYKNKNINFKFLVDTNWEAKRFFNNWMAMAINPMSINANRPREVGYYGDYAGTIDIYSLTPIFEAGDAQNTEVPIYGIRLQEAWPTSLEAQNMASGAEGYHRLDVGVTYKWWEDILFGSMGVQDLLALLTGGAVRPRS